VVLLVFGAPCQKDPSLAGREHGRTIPLPEVRSPQADLA
jgi:hypothetical protein